MREFAYIRVSSKDQNECRQVIAMKSRGIPAERIFLEKLSGKNTRRPRLLALMKKVRRGDVVVVESISRFARNTRDFLELAAKLSKKGVEFISLKELIDTTTPTGRFMLTIFAAVAELEREHILERQAEGIVAAKAQGKHLGRPAKGCPENFAVVVENWERGSIRLDDVLKQTGLKRATFFNRLREMRSEQK
ncbi:MAG: recombinase family protein [Defluviitaleaceae bacterium]|nr:recombinase family protein [Defluviitaleaceae bacterium]